jgi:tetratricopeptide (TPR) repeat protein
MKKNSGWQRMDQVDPALLNQNAPGFQKPVKARGSNFISFAMLLAFGVCAFLNVQNHSRNNTFTGPPSTELPKPILEIKSPSPQDQTDIDNGEEQLLKKVAALPPQSPSLFELYGNFGAQCQDRAMYSKAQKYFAKALALGPSAYKSYDFKTKPDYEANYTSMLIDIGKLKEAEQVSREIWQKQTEVLGPLNETSLNAGVEAAQCLGYNSKYKEQQTFCEKLIGEMEAAGKTDSSSYVALMTSLGESHQGQNQMHDAKVCYEKALAVAKKHSDWTLYNKNLNETLAQFGQVK